MVLGSHNNSRLRLLRFLDRLSSNGCDHGKRRQASITMSVANARSQYAIDCYKPVSGQILVTSTVVKNTFGVSSPEHTCNFGTDISLSVRDDVLHQRLDRSKRFHGTHGSDHWTCSWATGRGHGVTHDLGQRSEKDDKEQQVS